MTCTRTHKGIAGLADSGVILGKHNPKVADDTIIRAKKGEYLLSDVDVALLGGPEKIDAMIKKLRAAHGLPTMIGPKGPNEPDMLGRMDNPKLADKGIAAGLADGGSTSWKPPYETDLSKLAAAHPIANVVGLGIPAIAQKLAGAAGNVVSAMSAPTDPMAMVKGRTQDIAEQLGSTTRNIARPTAVATQIATRQPVLGISNPVTNKSMGTNEVKRPLPPQDSQTSRTTSTPPIEPLTRYENLGLGPNDLSRTSTGQVLAPVKPVGIAGGDGTGFATVGAKRAGYQDIGTRQDPLYSRRTDGIATAPDGQTLILGNAAGYRPSHDVDWSPGSANYRNAQLEAADRLGMTSDGRGGFRPMNQGERDATGLTTKQEYLTRNNQDILNQLAVISGNTGNMYDGDQKIEAARMRIAALKGQNAQLQQGIAGDQTLAGQKYVADAGVAAHGIAGQATVEAARLGADARNNAALAESMREQQKQQLADRQNEQKRRDDQVKSYLGRYDWGKISPTAANEFAGLLVDTDGKGYVTLRDPSGTHGDILVHQSIEQALRGAYGKIRTADQFKAYLNQAQKLGGNKAPVFQTQIRNTANLPLIKSKQDPLLPEGNTNG